MIYGEIGEMAAFAIGGFALGTMYGRKLAGDVSALVHSLELRVAAIEHAAGGSAGAASQANVHAAALEKLAGAIEKHAAAIDDHGAATVAAAVESSAAASSTSSAAQ